MTTRGEEMLALRRARMASSPPVLRGGFRPFFLGGALWATIALACWLAVLAGWFSLPSAMDSLIWHRHEMLFGFVGAVIAGFLLTAVPNWTGRLPIAGLPLALLFGLWLSARMAVLYSAALGVIVPAALDAGFYIILAAVTAREVLAAKNRNLPVVGLVLLLGIANATDHAAAAGWLADTDLGIRAAISLVAIIISIIGGRIIPSFTRNWMTKQGITTGLPSQPARFDLLVIGATALALLAWTVTADIPLTGSFLVLAGALQAIRLLRWGGLRTATAPIVAILHIGYAWLPLGLLLLGMHGLDLAVPRSAAIHALTAGAMGTMILAVMTRATLGHTGRELAAGLPTVTIYILVTVGAALRVAASLEFVDYAVGMELAGGAWGGAFVLFLAVYGPMLLRQHVSDPSR